MNYPNRIIKEGESNVEIVKAIQQQLTDLGYGPFNNPGVFNAKTTIAVKLFQSTHSDQKGNPLITDGKLGSITWSVLFGQGSVLIDSTAGNVLSTEAVNVAKTQIGVTEDPPGSNKGKQVNEYLLSAGCEPGSYWCASFVYWCFKQAAAKLNIPNPLCKTPGCLFHWNNTSGTKIIAKDAVNNPSLLKAGQIFIMDHGGGTGHTGIIEQVDGGFIQTIEGNSNNNGSRNGIGVFQIQRKIASINKGFIQYN